MNVTKDRKELFSAISKAQAQFTTVEKGKANPFFKSMYAPLDSIIEMIRPILPLHGLSVVQFTDIPADGQGVVIETVITHESGQYISGKLLMPMAKADPQGAGSAITYGRRYALAAALGIVSDEDVDGNGHDEKKKTTPTPKTATGSDNKTTVDTTTLPKVNQALHDELAAYCQGDTAKMDTVLKRVSRYESDGKEYFFGMDKLSGVSEKWAGKVLTALKKLVTAETAAQASQDDIPF